MKNKRTVFFLFVCLAVWLVVLVACSPCIWSDACDGQGYLMLTQAANATATYGAEQWHIQQTAMP